MSPLVHFLNGKFVSEKELLISPRDLGFVRGYAVNDFIFTVNHQPFKLTEHIDRLFRSAEIYGLYMPWSKAQVATWVKQTLDKNDKSTEKTIKIVVSGGPSPSMYQADTPTIVMIVDQYREKPSSYYKDGIKVQAVKYKRSNPEAKHTNHVEAIKHLAKVKDEGITEVLYYDEFQVYEAGRSNLFAVIDNKLVTSKSNIVKGIIRETLLEILQLNVPIEVRDFTYDELLKATEVFVTYSRNGAIGVIEISGRMVGNGRVGSITNEVATQYKAYLTRISQH